MFDQWWSFTDCHPFKECKAFVYSDIIWWCYLLLNIISFSWNKQVINKFIPFSIDSLFLTLSQVYLMANNVFKCTYCFFAKLQRPICIVKPVISHSEFHIDYLISALSSFWSLHPHNETVLDLWMRELDEKTCICYCFDRTYNQEFNHLKGAQSPTCHSTHTFLCHEKQHSKRQGYRDIKDNTLTPKIRWRAMKEEIIKSEQ